MLLCFYLPEQGWFYALYIYSPVNDVIARFGWIVSELMYSFDMITHVVMSVNRFTAVYFPIKYEKWWSGRNLKIVISAQLILPVIICYNAIWIHGTSGTFILSDDGTIGYSVRDDNIFTLTFIIDAVETLICALICLLLNTATGIKYRKITKNQLSEQKNRGGLELRLYFHSLAMLCFQTIFLIYNLSYAIAMIENNYIALSFINSTYRWLVDSIIFGNSLSLILISKNVRNEYLSFVGLKIFMKTNDHTVHPGRSQLVQPVRRSSAIRNHRTTETVNI